jgi:DNA repair protein RecO (recombination protein O)
MPLTEFEGVVLRQYDLGEADRIIVLLTAEHGKVRCVARGIRKSLSRIAGALEPLNQVHFEYYAREGAELGHLRRSELIHSFLGRNPSLEKVFAFSYFAEVAMEMVQEGQENRLVYRLLLSSLRAGERVGVNPSLVRYFEAWSLKLGGVLPDCRYCSRCSRCVTHSRFYVRPEAGQVFCSECAEGRGLLVEAEAAAGLDRVWNTAPEEYAREGLSTDVARALGRLTHSLFETHIDKEFRSLAPLNQLLIGG